MYFIVKKSNDRVDARDNSDARAEKNSAKNGVFGCLLEHVVLVLVHLFFSLPLIFTLHWWPLKNFHVCFPTKKSLLGIFYLSL